jgi:Xaa-Pro aminopeptidase
MNHFAKIQAALQGSDCEAMLLTGEANRFYASGFHSTGGDGVALVTRKEAYYFTDSRYIEAAEAQVQDAAIAMVDRQNSYLARINEVLDRCNIQKLGFEENVVTMAEYARLEEHLTAELFPASALVEHLRQSKDEAELSSLIAAQRIAEGALTLLLEELRPGLTEKEVAARLQYLMLCGGAEKMSFDPIVASGPHSSMPHAVPTDRKLEKGDFVTMDFGCVYHGYCSDMTHTVALGSVSDEMRRVYDTVLQAQLAGIAAARGGVSGQDVDGAARSVIEQAGYGAYFGHAFGHSVGIEIHENPNATPGNLQPLPVGCVISAEPGIYLPGKFGVRIEDVIVLTADGCRDITQTDKSLLVL